MPYTVEKDEDACSAEKPWAVKTEGSSTVHGCHATKEEAQDQQAALYANTEESAIAAAVAEFVHMATSEEEPEDFPTPEVTYEQDGIVLTKLVGIELVSAGMYWPASTGKVTFGANHFEAAASASADPLIPRARIKLGHTDPRYNPHECPNCQHEIPPDLDAIPSFGFVENLQIQSSGVTLSGDFVDVPLWLARVMPVAFPSRSIEGWFAHMGPNKKPYDFVLTAVALLGVQFPAILNIEDLPALYGAEMPDYVEVNV